MNARKKIFVIDYDNCAIDEFGELSPKVINQAKEGEYSGFYGCTHRSYLEVNQLVTQLNNAKDKRSHFESMLKDQLTHSITDKFASKTKLPCIAVSMFDDNLYSECGTAYETVIKPYETTGIVPQQHQHVSPEAIVDVKKYDPNTKNTQLLQIAQHAANKHPYAVEIELDYLDDRMDLCNSAIEAAKQSDWPENVTLNIYHHSAKDYSDIRLIGKSKKDPMVFSYTPSGEMVIGRLFEVKNRAAPSNLNGGLLSFMTSLKKK